MIEKYDAPTFLPSAVKERAPKTRARLCQDGTRIHEMFGLGGVPRRIFIKRDDDTGGVASGNKIRKLEFLLADAVARGCDSVVTMGTGRSNFARATAVGCRQMRIDPHILVRVDSVPPTAEERDARARSLIGNELATRLCGAQIRMFTAEQRDSRGGGRALISEWASELRAAGRRPCEIPAGGSNALGSWGYLQCAAEIAAQCARGSPFEIDDVVVACGTGGTLAGIGLGVQCAFGGAVRTHGVCMNDDSRYFLDVAESLLSDLGATDCGFHARDFLHVLDGYQGIGYDRNTDEELRLMADIASRTGVILDPVYTLKAMRAVLVDPCFRDRRVLLVHTGGFLGAFEKVDRLAEILPPMSFLS